MTVSSVKYTSPNGVNAGAVPFATDVATHNRETDSKVVQDVYLDGTRIDFVGRVWVAQPYRTHGSTFVGTTIDSSFWTSAVANNGTNTQATGLMTMASGTTAAGLAALRTVRAGRFIFFNPVVARMAVRVPTVAVADNTRRWGSFTDSSGVPQNGYYYELSSAGALSIKAVNATTSTINVSSGSFNGDVSTYVVDTNVHAYEIHYFVMRVDFYIDNVLVHSARPTTTNFTGSYTLPINFVTINGATGGVDGQLHVWSANSVRSGRETTQPRAFMQTGTVTAQVLKRGPGDIHSLEISAVQNNAVITLYDNTTNSGTVIWTSGVLGAQTQPFGIDLHEVPFETGLTLSITAANASVIVVYE